MFHFGISSLFFILHDPHGLIATLHARGRTGMMKRFKIIGGLIIKILAKIEKKLYLCKINQSSKYGNDQLPNRNTDIQRHYRGKLSLH